MHMVLKYMSEQLNMQRHMKAAAVHPQCARLPMRCVTVCTLTWHSVLLCSAVMRCSCCAGQAHQYG